MCVCVCVKKWIIQKPFRLYEKTKFGYTELENNNAAQASILTDFASQTTPGIDKSGLSLKTELKSSSPMDPNKPQTASPTKRKIFFQHIFKKLSELFWIYIIYS